MWESAAFSASYSYRIIFTVKIITGIDVLNYECQSSLFHSLTFSISFAAFF